MRLALFSECECERALLSEFSEWLLVVSVKPLDDYEKLVYSRECTAGYGNHPRILSQSNGF